MLSSELEQYLHNHIPLSKAMEVSVVTVEDKLLVLGAPLSPNINHHSTVFGGSASALAILAAWTLLHHRLTEAGIATRLVIQRNAIEYEAPMAGAFIARAALVREADWEPFIRMLKRKGRARIAVGSLLECGDEIGCRFTGEFVALGSEQPIQDQLKRKFG